MANLSIGGGKTAFASGYPNNSDPNKCFKDTGIDLLELTCSTPWLALAENAKENRIVLDLKECNKPIRLRKIDGKYKSREYQINAQLQFDTGSVSYEERAMGPVIYTGHKYDKLEWLEVCDSMELQMAFEKIRMRQMSETINTAIGCEAPSWASKCNTGDHWEAEGINLGTPTAPVGLTRNKSDINANKLVQYVLSYIMSGQDLIKRNNLPGVENIGLVLPSRIIRLIRSSEDRTSYMASGETGGYMNYCKDISDMCGISVFEDTCACAVGTFGTPSPSPVFQLTWVSMAHMGAKIGVIEEFKGETNLTQSLGVYSATFMRYGAAVLRGEAVATGYVYAKQ